MNASLQRSAELFQHIPFPNLVTIRERSSLDALIF